MRIEELEVVCQEAARNVVARQERPLRPSVVLPLPEATRVITLPDWPDDDGSRTALLERFADEVMRPANAACFGFVAEGVAGDPPQDVVVLVYGARRVGAAISATILHSGEVDEFVPSEPLDPAAMPFLRPLQDAVDAATAPDAFGLSS